MVCEPVSSRPLASRILAGATVLGLALAAPGAGAQQPAPGGEIYTCIDNSGNRLTSDRPIPACLDRDQRVLNRDGSLRRIIPRQLTADERAAQEARERRLSAERNALREAIRADRNLIQRYPDEGAHLRARSAALDTANEALTESRRRLAELAEERKPLLDEAEFYKGKTLPPKLKQQFDANDAAQDAQRSLVVRAEAEIVRINSFYDSELARLRKLWAGADPGSLGAPPKP